MRVSLVASAMLGGVAASSEAQLVVTADVSQSHIRYTDSIRLTAPAITPAMRLSKSWGNLEALASYSPGNNSGWTVQGILTGTTYTRTIGKFLGELTGIAGGSAQAAGSRTAQLSVMSRMHMLLGASGVWIGLGAGRASDDLVWRGMAQGELGGWKQWGNRIGSITVTPIRLGDTVSYVDAQGALEWTHRVFGVGISGGTRWGRNLAAFGDSRNLWIGADLSVKIARRLSLTAGLGTYPGNPMQGFPSGRFATVGIRVNVWDPYASAASLVERTDDMSNDVSRDVSKPENILTLRVISTSSNQTTLYVNAGNAQRVEIAGDFTNWRPVAFTRTYSGHVPQLWWALTLPIPAGTYQMNVRVDGGLWQVPASLARVVDEFGGSAGLLVVPPKL